MLIAMLLAYICLLRKSEYLDEATSDHYMRADDVWFEVEHPDVRRMLPGVKKRAQYIGA